MAKSSEIHIGKRIKEVLSRSNLSVKKFSEKINKTRTLVYDIFRRSAIDTSLLEKISKVLNHDFFAEYSEEIFSGVSEEREQYITKIAELEKQNNLLEKLNDLLEEKEEKKK